MAPAGSDLERATVLREYFGKYDNDPDRWNRYQKAHHLEIEMRSKRNDVVDILLSTPGYLENIHGVPSSLLEEAMRSKRNDVVNILLSTPGYFENIRTFPSSLVEAACILNRVDAMRMLLKHDSVRNILSGWRTAKFAVQYSSPDMLRLIYKDWIPTHSDERKNNALKLAIEIGRRDMIPVLFELFHAALNSQAGCVTECLLNVLQAGDYDMARFILTAGGNPQPMPPYIFTIPHEEKPSLLGAAVEPGLVDAVKWLLHTVRLHPDGAMLGSLTPVAIALKHGHRDILKILLEAGAHPELKTYNTRLNSMFYKMSDRDMDMVEMCLMKSSEYAATVSWVEEVKMLASKPGMQDSARRVIEGKTLLHSWAARELLECPDTAPMMHARAKYHSRRHMVTARRQTRDAGRHRRQWGVVPTAAAAAASGTPRS